MKYEYPLLDGRFISRRKRFFIDIETAEGDSLTLYCPNTGSMMGCLTPGNPVKYSLHGDREKKLPGVVELIQVELGQSWFWVGVNTQRANKLTYEAIQAGQLPILAGYPVIESEVKYGTENSRIDFLLSRGTGEQGKSPDQSSSPVYVEVKSVTLGYETGLGAFPDAKTTRGQKHLRELALMAQQGAGAVLVYCVQHEGVREVSVASHIDPDYGKLLKEALGVGLEICAFRVKFDGVGLIFDGLLEFSLDHSLSDQALGVV